MKLFLILALIINVTGHGQIPAEGMDLIVTEATSDPFTGLQLMSLEGSVETSNPLIVTITRSHTGLTDEFCCGLCTTGNGETSETLSFTPGGTADWYVHYFPAADSDEQISYLFSDGTDSRELRVHYIYSAQGIETITNDQLPSTYKIIKGGQLLIIKNNKTYRIL